MCPGAASASSRRRLSPVRPRNVHLGRGRPLGRAGGDAGVLAAELASGRPPPASRRRLSSRAPGETGRCCRRRRLDLACGRRRLPPSPMPTAACRPDLVRTTGSPSTGSAWDEGLRRLAATARAGAAGGGHRADLYWRLPESRITDILLRGGRRHPVHRGLQRTCERGEPCRGGSPPANGSRSPTRRTAGTEPEKASTTASPASTCWSPPADPLAHVSAGSTST